MSAVVIKFPRPKAAPNVVQVQFDFGNWALGYYQDHRFISRLDFPSKAAAEAEALRLSEGGMTWRMGDGGTVYIMADGTDGGCWAVAHRSRSEGSDAILGRHMSIDDAIPHAIRAATELKADLVLNGHIENEGGAA
jgi:hypothetical protein